MTVRIQQYYCKSRTYTKPRHTSGPAFKPGKDYFVNGFDHDDEGNGYVILVNEYKQLWWVNNRHVRVSQANTDDSLTNIILKLGIENLQLKNQLTIVKRRYVEKVKSQKKK